MASLPRVPTQRDPTRRTFLTQVGGCLGWLSLAHAGPSWARSAFGGRRGRVVREEPWGRLEEVGEGIWALISTPLVDHPDARRTLCNGGIVAGRDGVLVIEGFGTEAGAEWMAAQAATLTGQRPTHVVVTHFHGDHCNGLRGYGTDPSHPRRLSTQATRQLLEERSRLPVERRMFPYGVISIRNEGRIDLGGRRVRVIATSGHTPSDVILRVEDPPVVFCGDLVWNGMFPNYVDAIPPSLDEAVAAIGAEAGITYVPGHGALADAAAMRRYAELLGHVGDAARQALEQGVPMEEAAERYRLPTAMQEWVLFSPSYFRVAFQAWERAIGRSQ